MKTNRLIILFLLLLFTMSNYSCTNDSEDDLIISNEPDDDPDDDDPNDPEGSTTVNYIEDVRPIMQSSCVGCHSSPPVNGAPFALVNFNQVSQRASASFNRMSRQNGAAGAMPPSGRLPQSTIDIIQDWIEAGRPED